MSLVQLTQRTYHDEKTGRGETPFFEFDLLEHEKIVGVFHYWTTDYEDRKTVDHHLCVWVEVRL